MNKKLTLLLIAVLGVFLCANPIMASENNLGVNSLFEYSLLDMGDVTGQFSLEKLTLVKEIHKHTDSSGNTDEHSNYYLNFTIPDDSEIGNYQINITSYDKDNNIIKSEVSGFNEYGNYSVDLDNSSEIENVTVSVLDENNNVIYDDYTGDVKEIVDSVVDEPVKDTSSESSSTSSSSSDSGHVYWASANSDKFHEPSCRWAKKIKSSNKIVFNSRDDAISAGYKPCKVCSP